jgi:hypothetical protein
MKTRFPLLAAFAALLVAGSAFAAPAPVQVALFDPAQLVKDTQSVGILRLDLIYGKNENVTGLDLGLLNHTTGDETSFTYGIASVVQGKFTGWQDNAINIADKSFLGLQSGVVNKAGEGHGVQFGWVNVTDRMSGLQVGLVNYTKVMDKGLQVGIGNIITEGPIKFLPIVNWRF